jgi:nitroreductase
MDFFDVVDARQSIRAFMPQPIEPEKLQQILTAIDRAPSAGNLQGYEVYLVTNRHVLQGLARSTSGQDFIAQAPLALVFCAHPARSAQKYGQRGTTLYCVQDATIACAFAQLAVTAVGLASVWVGAFDEDSVRAARRSSRRNSSAEILSAYASRLSASPQRVRWRCACRWFA